ncbi:hypothetical protein [Parasphingorhabdus sp.]|uniref:hypothetical protein n=1 Tax=Parasphingorhabdus sp. TaxID=2709688 RepID=UPI0030018A61
MMGLLESIIGVGILMLFGTLGANFLFQTLRPDWDRRKHILWSSMVAPLGLWLLVTFVLGFEAISGGGFYPETIIPIVVLAILGPFTGALFGIPTSLLVLKYTNWKK